MYFINASFSAEEFELWSVLFRYYNSTKGTIKCGSGAAGSITGRIRLKEIDFFGKAALWELFSVCESPTVPAGTKSPSPPEMIA
jgi:hypothetical protein